MPTPLTDADKVIRNDTGLAIVQAIQGISAPAASNVPYDNTTSGLTADDVQDAIDELKTANDAKMDKADPTGTGSLSLNRKANTTTGAYSGAMGNACEASGDRAFAFGYQTVASANQSFAEGYSTNASGNSAHAENYSTEASGMASHAEGRETIANHLCQHVFGYRNIADPSTAVAGSRGNYIEIVGNGSSSSTRSNARTLDWSGNEVLAGGLKLHTDQDAATLNVSSSIAAGSTYDFTNYSDGTVIFVYRPADAGQSDYTGIYIRSGTWTSLIPIKAAPNVTTSGYVLTNSNSQALRCAIIST